MKKILIGILGILLLVSGSVFAQSNSSSKYKCKANWTSVWNADISILSSQEGAYPAALRGGSFADISNALRQNCQVQVMLTIDNSINTGVYRCDSASVWSGTEENSPKHTFSCRYGGGEKGDSDSNLDVVFAPEINISQGLDGVYLVTYASTPQGDLAQFLPKSFEGIANGKGKVAVYTKK